MLGPDALSAENAEATLASLDRMSNMPSKQPEAAPKPAASSTGLYQRESSYESDVLGLSRIVEDANRMQRRPQQSAFHAVHDAAKGVLFDLEDDIRCRCQHIQVSYICHLPFPGFRLICPNFFLP